MLGNFAIDKYARHNSETHNRYSVTGVTVKFQLKDTKRDKRDRRDSKICTEKVDSNFIIIYIIYNIYNNNIIYNILQVGNGAKKTVTPVTL